MIPDPEAFPVLELSPAELLEEHTGRRETRWIAGQWVSLSRARLGPEEPSSSP